MELSNVPAAVHSPMWDTTGTFPLHCLLPRKYCVSRHTNMFDNVESGPGKEMRTVTAYHWVLMCAARVTSYSQSCPFSCILFCFDLNFPRSLSLRCSFSVFLPSSKQGSPARRGGYLSLTLSLYSLSFSVFSLSFTLANRTSNSLLSPNTPPIQSFFFPPTRLWWTSVLRIHACEVGLNVDGQGIGSRLLWNTLVQHVFSSCFTFWLSLRCRLCTCVSLFLSLFASTPGSFVHCVLGVRVCLWVWPGVGYGVSGEYNRF